MKKSWIIVLVFVFLWSAAPAFSVPVPKNLCLQFDGFGDSIRLLLKSKGKLGGVEYFDAAGSYVYLDGAFLLDGSAHRQGKKVLHLGLTGTVDVDGPGGGGITYHQSYDIKYNLKKEKAAMSGLSHYGQGQESNTDIFTLTLTAVACSSLSKPPR